MKNTYQIIEGCGDPENPSTLWNVGMLEITFSNFDQAVNFAWSHYNQTTKRMNDWKSYFSSVTTCTNTEDALAELVQEMKENK
jgi:hypothetical protein